MKGTDNRAYQYRFSGHEFVLHNVRAEQELPSLLDRLGYQKVFVVCSRSLNTKTAIMEGIRASLGSRLVGLTDEVGEHSPLRNVLQAARDIRDAGADVILSVGGGSVMDMCKAIQLCISEGAYQREDLLKYQFVLSADGTEMLSTSTAAPAIRQIAIPTTLSTSEWTPVSTPVDEETSLKARFSVPAGAPVAVIYDPEILSQTPIDLLLSTGVRGLDHAVNTFCSTAPHPFTSLLTARAIKLFMENLPLLKEQPNPEAFTNCQLASWFTGMGQMSVPHGFSHWMVHIVGPYGNVPHSDAACVLMLAQAKWLEGWATEQQGRLCQLLGSRQPFHELVHEFLMRLGMPVCFEDLGLTPKKVEEMIQPALQHPMVTKNNIRRIQTEDDLRAILKLAFKNP